MVVVSMLTVENTLEISTCQHFFRLHCCLNLITHPLGLLRKIKETYTLICSLRSLFSNKSVDRAAAKTKLHEWYQKVSACTLREVKAARDAIKYKEEEVLNYFFNRSTNAHAESFNSKLKGFRAQLRGVQDLPFFMYRTTKIFG